MSPIQVIDSYTELRFQCILIMLIAWLISKVSAYSIVHLLRSDKIGAQ